MSAVLKEKWFWIIVLAVSLVIGAPLLVVWVILNLPPLYQLLATVLLVILWGVAAGYKEWVIEKRKEEEKKGGKPSS